MCRIFIPEFSNSFIINIDILQVTRLYNAVAAASYLRHVTHLAHDYAESRSAFGHTINTLPLHQTSLAKLETFNRALILQTVDLALIVNAKVSNQFLKHSDEISVVQKLVFYLKNMSRNIPRE